MEKAIRTLFYFGPLLFAFGFIAPLVAQTITALDLLPPFGLSPLHAGLIISALMGIPAQFRGSWI